MTARNSSVANILRPGLRCELAAHSYARQGIPVFPCRGKHPLTEHGLKDATIDAKQIDAWWGRWPDANVAIATGAASGFVVIDVDPRHGGNESLAALERKFGPLPETAQVRTGGGGRICILQFRKDC